jgi:fructokinase
VLGGIEAGGTKIVCGVGTGPADLRAVTRFPTTTPAETIARAVAALAGHDVEAVGIASFGPLDLDPASPGFGRVTATPKPGWEGTDVAGEVKRLLGVPVAIDTDVNGAALAEWRWGAARDLDTFVYLTIGTGIGGGGMVNGDLMHGLSHPEMGHMLVPHHPDDPFPGACPFHGDCLEGLAAGPAIEQRWGRPAGSLGVDTGAAVALQAHYVAVAVVELVTIVSPRLVILGGGVMKMPGLIDEVRRRVPALLGGYFPRPADRIDRFIVPPALGDDAGVLGGLALAGRAGP